jgi:hypothetical protein
LLLRWEETVLKHFTHVHIIAQTGALSKGGRTPLLSPPR